MTSTTYAVIPDGQQIPAAIFTELDEAIDWALRTYGGDRFAIKSWDTQRGGPAGPGASTLS